MRVCAFLALWVSCSASAHAPVADESPIRPNLFYILTLRSMPRLAPGDLPPSLRSAHRLEVVERELRQLFRRVRETRSRSDAGLELDAEQEAELAHLERKETELRTAALEALEVLEPSLRSPRVVRLHAQLLFERAALAYVDALDREEEVETPDHGLAREMLGRLLVHPQLTTAERVEALYFDGYLALEMGDYDGAQQQWRSGLSMEPVGQLAEELAFRVGELEFDEGHFEEAANHYRRALRVAVEVPRLRRLAAYKLAWSEHLADRPRHALLAAARASWRRTPNELDADLERLVVVILRTLDDPERALQLVGYRPEPAHRILASLR